MNKLGLFSGIGSLLLAAPAAFAQGTESYLSGTTKAPPYVLPGQMQQTPASAPVLFKVAGLRVRLWAPVPASYDSNANRNRAADPLWVGGRSAGSVDAGLRRRPTIRDSTGERPGGGLAPT